MKKRKGKFGEFFGCTSYSQCKANMNLRDAQLEEDLNVSNRPDRWDD